MICQTCRATIDNDLVFCTNCGGRLYEPAASDAATIAIKDSVVTQSAVAAPSKKNSPFKWIALIIAFVALPVILGIAYLLTKNQAVLNTTNVNKSAPVNRKINAATPAKNTDLPAPNATVENVADNNSNVENTNRESNRNNPETTTIFDEQIEIAAGEHIAYPFKADGNVKVFGKIETLRGESVTGYFYIQNVYDEYFPDPTYKVSNFKEKKPEIRQYLVAGDYVLVFLNENKSSTVIKGKLEMQPNE